MTIKHDKAMNENQLEGVKNMLSHSERMIKYVNTTKGDQYHHELTLALNAFSSNPKRQIKNDKEFSNKIYEAFAKHGFYFFDELKNLDAKEMIEIGQEFLDKVMLSILSFHERDEYFEKRDREIAELAILSKISSK